MKATLLIEDFDPTTQKDWVLPFSPKVSNFELEIEIDQGHRKQEEPGDDG